MSHAIAALAMALVLREGLATNPDVAARFRFVVGHRVLWTAAWLCWNVAALSILYFFACLSRAHRTTKLVLVVAAVAVTVDLTAEMIAIVLFPEANDPGKFAWLSRVVELLSGGVANALYTTATILSVWATRHEYPQSTRLAGSCVALAGVALSVSALGGSIPGMVWSNVVLIPALILWQLGVAIAAGKRTDVLPSFRR